MTDQVLHMPVTIETRQGEFIKAPSRSVLNAIAKANAEHALASDAVVNAIEAKNAAMRHAIACGKALLKAKEKVGHGGWGRLFSDSNEQSEGSKNCSFAFTKNQANRYIKVASYPEAAGFVEGALSGVSKIY